MHLIENLPKHTDTNLPKSVSLGLLGEYKTTGVLKSVQHFKKHCISDFNLCSKHSFPAIFASFIT